MDYGQRRDLALIGDTRWSVHRYSLAEIGQSVKFRLNSLSICFRLVANLSFVDCLVR